MRPRFWFRRFIWEQTQLRQVQVQKAIRQLPTDQVCLIATEISGRHLLTLHQNRLQCPLLELQESYLLHSLLSTSISILMQI